MGIKRFSTGKIAKTSTGKIALSCIWGGCCWQEEGTCARRTRSACEGSGGSWGGPNSVCGQYFCYVDPCTLCVGNPQTFDVDTGIAHSIATVELAGWSGTVGFYNYGSNLIEINISDFNGSHVLADNGACTWRKYLRHFEEGHPGWGYYSTILLNRQADPFKWRLQISWRISVAFTRYVQWYTDTLGCSDYPPYAVENNYYPSLVDNADYDNRPLYLCNPGNACYQIGLTYGTGSILGWSTP